MNLHSLDEGAAIAARLNHDWGARHNLPDFANWRYLDGEIHYLPPTSSVHDPHWAYCLHAAKTLTIDNAHTRLVCRVPGCTTGERFINPREDQQ